MTIDCNIKFHERTKIIRMERSVSEELRWWSESGRSITPASVLHFNNVSGSRSWSVFLICDVRRLWTFRGESRCLLLGYPVQCFIVTFVFYDSNPRERWLVYIWADNETFTIPRCRYQIYNSCNVACLCYSTALFYATLRTLRYVDEVMDLLSILTRMLDGQSFEISPNKWHSLCTPPVCRSTRPNDLTNNQQNYQTQHGTANSRGVPYSC